MDERKEDGKKTVTSIVMYTIANVISIVVSFITLPILTNIMSSEDLGIATTFYTLKNILSIICLLAISNAIDRIMLDAKDKEYQNLSSLFIFSSVFSVIIFLIYLVFREPINSLLGFNTPMMILMFAMIFIINGSTIYTTYCNFKNNYKTTFIYNILASPVAQIISLVLVYFMADNKYLGRIIGVDIFNIITGVLFGIIILFRGRCTIKKKYVKDALIISLPLIPHLLSQVLLSNCDLLMIKNLSGASEAGIYSMAYSISNVLYLVLIQLFKPWSPWIYRRMKNDETDTIKDNSSFLLTGAAFLSIGLFTVAPDAIKIFLNVEYLPSATIIAPICAGIFFQILYIFFYDIEYYYKKNKNIAIFSVIAAIINIILNYVCIKAYGYQAAAYTTLISYAILSILHYLGMRKVEKRKLYNIKYFMLLSIIIITFAIISVLNIESYIIRYSLLIIFTIFTLIKYGKRIKEMAINLLKEKGILKKKKEN